MTNTPDNKQSGMDELRRIVSHFGGKCAHFEEVSSRDVDDALAAIQSLILERERLARVDQAHTDFQVYYMIKIDDESAFIEARDEIIAELNQKKGAADDTEN